MHYRAHFVAIFVGDRVKDKSLPLREAYSQPPALPSHLPAVDLEARAVRLDRKSPDAFGTGMTP
jgi:hypothetical protein